MSISVQSKSPLEAEELTELNHLPCKIDFNGEITTLPQYFKPKCNGNSSTAVFRGILLDGKSTKLPEDYSGLIINEKNKPFGEEESRTFSVCGRFSDFTQWYVESQYTSKDTITPTCDVWLNQLSPALHNPI